MGNAASSSSSSSSSQRRTTTSSSTITSRSSPEPSARAQQLESSPSANQGPDGAPGAGAISEEDEDRPAAPGSLGPIASMKAGYDALVCAIIRPPRASYSQQDLGPTAFILRGRRFVRSDLSLTNQRGLSLQCSHWHPAPTDRPAAQLPTVIYLHGNSSCRLGALEVLETLLLSGATVFALDTSGSGISGGEYVTLGHNEKDDLSVAIDHLRASGDVSTIGLWGRSMGAATALLHSHRDPSIAALVLDSAFADLKQLALELVDAGRDSGLRVPSLLVSGALRMVRSSVQKRAGFDIYSLRPIAHAPSSFVPALFCAGESDNFVRPHHSADIHAAYGSDFKNIILVEGDHNSPRPRFLHDSAAIFIRAAMQIPDNITLDDASPTANYRTLAAAWHAAALEEESGTTARGTGPDAASFSARRLASRRMDVAAEYAGHGAAHPIATASEEEMVQQAIMASLALRTAVASAEEGGEAEDADAVTEDDARSAASGPRPG